MQHLIHLNVNGKARILGCALHSFDVVRENTITQCYSVSYRISITRAQPQYDNDCMYIDDLILTASFPIQILTSHTRHVEGLTKNTPENAQNIFHALFAVHMSKYISICRKCFFLAPCPPAERAALILPYLLLCRYYYFITDIGSVMATFFLRGPLVMTSISSMLLPYLLFRYHLYVSRRK